MLSTDSLLLDDLAVPGVRPGPSIELDDGVGGAAREGTVVCNSFALCVMSFSSLSIWLSSSSSHIELEHVDEVFPDCNIESEDLVAGGLLSSCRQSHHQLTQQYP